MSVIIIKGFINIIKQYEKIIIYDENSKSGGILPIINKCLLNHKVNKKIKFLTSTDKQIFNYYQDREAMILKQNLGKESLKKLI